MSNKLFTLCLVFLFAATLINAQEKSKVLVDDTKNVPVVFNSAVANIEALAGEPIGVTTDYDYFTNSVNRDQIVWDATLGTPHLLNMVRNTSVAATRFVYHSYKSGGSWVNNDILGAQAGWPHIDLGLTGDGEGVLVGVFHTPSRFFIWDGTTGYPATQFNSSTDPSVQIAGANVYLAVSGNRTTYQFYNTTDFGVSFTNWDSIPSWHPTPIWWAGNGGVEVGMSKSTNEQNLVMFGTNVGDGVSASSVAHVYNGWAKDSCDAFWAIYSTNSGTTWTGQTIAWDGDFDIVDGYHTPMYAPLFENFGQVDMAVGNDGAMHAVANGYGLIFNATGDTAIGNSFPVLYWNSVGNTWKSISSEAIDTVQAIGDYYPTNSIGQAYPSVSVSEDGQVVYVLWTGPQFTASGGLDTADNGAGVQYYWRDLYHAFSVDGGDTWTYGGVFPDMLPNQSEAFGTAAQHLEFIAPNTYRAHIVYLADLTTGVQPFDGVASNNPLVYTTFDIVLTSVGDDGNLVNNFELAQNYPNPFNPSTSISYTLAERSNVTLKVYDVLGKEVASLINTSQDAGTHQVTFDASNLSSGLYIYTLNAGNFTSSKKMMLLK